MKERFSSNCYAVDGQGRTYELMETIGGPEHAAVWETVAFALRTFGGTMAIYHCSSKPVSRSSGRSAVAAIAYRTASRLIDERYGLIHDFTAKQGVDHCEIILPDGVSADWALDRAALWNAAEAAERRSDSRVAREFEIALPYELDPRDRLSLARTFARDLADRYGAAVDVAIHRPGYSSDSRNVHAHLLMTTRKVAPDGFLDKTLIERENKWLIENNLPTSQMQLRDIRQIFEDHTNRHLLRAGFDIRVDHRSHPDRGLSIEPTQHVGVHASQMQRRGLEVSRTRLEELAAKRNADLIASRPQEVLRLLTDEKSVFDRHDVARTIHRTVNDNDDFQRALAAVMGSPQLVELQPEQDHTPAKYSTREMIGIEHSMAVSAQRMADRHNHGVRAKLVDLALDRQDEILADSALSDEQRTAVRHITSSHQIAAVIGFAGAGKSTMLSAARDAWQAQGYRVHGAALAGKAAEGLTASSGIPARTLASWEYGWGKGKGQLDHNDIFVIDEAGMVASRQLARIVAEIERRGAKLVLVGDHEQLQAIGAGSPFRAIAERIGTVELTDIRRQKLDWQREASVAFATHRTADGLRQYARHGNIRFVNDRKTTVTQLVQDYLADRKVNPKGSRIALAHRRVDVRAINDAIRDTLQREGLLAKASDRTTRVSTDTGSDTGPAAGWGNSDTGKANEPEKQNLRSPANREIIYQTVNGKRGFAPGDRIVLLENNRDLGVKNGMLGTVKAVEPNALHLRLDGASGGLEQTRHLSLPVKDYQSFDHGYATTIHKAQGATVDRAFVLASSTMDRHLTYVAMTRHRNQVTLHAARDDLKDMKTMVASMGRSGVKETTLDYEQAFAERRDLTSRPGEMDEMMDDIKLAPSLARVHDDQRPAGQPEAPGQGRPSDRRQADEEPSRDPADPALRPDHQDRQQARTVIQTGPAPAFPVSPVPHRSHPPAPLISPITHYDKSIDEAARETAFADMKHYIQTLRSIGQNVYRDPNPVADRFMERITGGSTNVQTLINAVKHHPEQFGELRGKSGLFGDNSERRQARHLADALSSHIGYAAKTWARRLDEERQLETRLRQHSDVVEVPELTRQSEAILTTLHQSDQKQRPKLLEQIVNTTEGRQAMAEAASITRALKQRFGTADRHELGKPNLRLAKDDLDRVDRIRQVARLVELAQRAELTRKHELERSMRKGLGLRI